MVIAILAALNDSSCAPAICSNTGLAQATHIPLLLCQPWLRLSTAAPQLRLLMHCYGARLQSKVRLDAVQGTWPCSPAHDLPGCTLASRLDCSSMV